MSKHGTIRRYTLEIEKIREIDPYVEKDFGLRFP